MKTRLFVAAAAVVGALNIVSVAQAAVFTSQLNGGNPLNLTSTRQSFAVNFGASTQTVRGVAISGNWTAGTGDPWSSELVASHTDSDINELGMGGQNNGNAFVFGNYASIYDNASNDGVMPFHSGAQSNTTVAGYAQAWMRQTFAGSNATLSNASMSVFTDVVAPSTGTFNANNVYQRAASVTGFGTGTLAATGSYGYRTMEFTTTVAGVYMFGADFRASSTDNGFDGWLSVYQGPFDPQNALTNLIGVDDDDAVVGGRAAAIWLNLQANQRYVLVGSTFDPIATATPLPTNAFTMFIAGPDQVIPEPGTMIALGLGAAALVARRRRK